MISTASRCETLVSSSFRMCVVGAALLGISTAGALAQDLYTIDVTAGGETTRVETFDTFEGFVDFLIGGDNDYTEADNDTGYTPGGEATFTGSLRGLDVNLEFEAGGSGVILVVPAIGLEIPYDLGDRDASVGELEDHLLENRNGDLSRILNALISETPFDPLAGNPASLQSKMVESDFGIGTGIGPGNSFSADPASANEEEDAPNLVGVGVRFGRYTAEGVDTTVIDIPLSYTIPLADPRWAVIIDAPLTYVETGNAEAYSASLGVGLRVPVFDNWSLTPAARVGITGSEALGSLGTLYSASLTSSYRFALQGLDVEIGNMVSYVASTPLEVEVAGYSLEYDLENFITRNGFGVTGDMNMELFNQPLVWEFNAVNTQIFGDEVFVDNYTDLAFSVGTQQSTNGLTFDSLRLGLTYTFSNQDYDGFRVNFGYQF